MYMRVLLAMALVLAITVPLAAETAKLILKDGAHHLVRSYERKGDRVRFFSVERDQWEELPA